MQAVEQPKDQIVYSDHSSYGSSQDQKVAAFQPQTKEMKIKRSSSNQIRCGTEGNGKFQLQVLTPQQNAQLAMKWLQQKGIYPGNPEQIIQEYRQSRKKTIRTIKINTTSIQGSLKKRQSSLMARRKVIFSNLHLKL